MKIPTHKFYFREFLWETLIRAKSIKLSGRVIRCSWKKQRLAEFVILKITQTICYNRSNMMTYPLRGINNKVKIRKLWVYTGRFVFTELCLDHELTWFHWAFICTAFFLKMLDNVLKSFLCLDLLFLFITISN